MGGGSSKVPETSLAIKEARSKAASLEAELARVELERSELESRINDRGLDIEKLGQINIDLTKQVERLGKDVNQAKEDGTNADKGLESLRKEQGEIKKAAAKMEAELRELKGELIVEKEDHGQAREEVERVGQMLTEIMQSKDEVEGRIRSIEEERDQATMLLRAATESMDMYKDLSSKLMHKKKDESAPKPAPGGPQAPVATEGAKQPGGAPSAAAAAKSTAWLLEPVKLKVPGRFKVRASQNP